MNLTDPGDQINAPNDAVSLQIQANDPDGDPLSYTATGLPSGLSINAGTGLISGTIASTAGSDTPYSVTVTASDGPHTASDTFNWTVANQAVTVTNPSTQSNAEGDNVSLQINATDPSGNGLSYSATGLPAGLQIDDASGLISGTLDSGDAATNGGVYTVTVLADDGQGNNGSTTFTWNVSHTNTAPSLDNPGDQVDQTGDVVSLPLSGYDDDGDTVTYSATGLPPGLSVNSTTGIISGTLPSSAASNTPYSVTATASDGTLTTNQTFNWFVTKNPVTLTSPGDQTNTEGDNVSLQLSATEANNSTLSYQASGLPSGLSINSSTGLISGTITSGDAANAPYTVTVTATDTQGYSSGEQFVWTVNPANLNPVVTNPGSQINTQGDVLSLPMQATDPADNGLSYSVTGLPPGLSIDPSSGLISGVLSSNSASGSPYSVTVTATDGSYRGNTTFTWSVTNQAVTVTNPGTQSSTGGQPASLQISASDPHGYSLTYAAVGLPPGLSINASTGLISGTIASSAGGAYQATVMASDNFGNSGSAAFTWNVTFVNQAPTLDNPGDQLNKPGDIVSLQLSGDDVDGDTVTYSATGLPSGLSINQTTGLISGTLPASAASRAPYSVTVTASDGTLTANQTFNWYVTSNVVTLTNPGDQTNMEGDTVSLQLSATDANKSALTYQASGLPSGLSINTSTGLLSGTVSSGDSANGPYTVTITADDAQGYSSYQQFNWTINAPTNGLTLTNPGNQSNAEGDDVSLQVQASDPDGDTLEYAASGLPIGLMIDPTTGLISGTVDNSAAEISNGQYNVTVTVNDGNGQRVSQSFVWAISDTPQAPWLAYPGLQNNAIGDNVNLQLVAGSPDNNTLTYSATGLPAGLGINAQTGLISGQITAAAGSYTVTAVVTDTANQSASQTFTWQVSNTAAQVILAINGTVGHSDDVGIVNPSVTIPLTITLVKAGPGLHTVQISIPSDRSEVSKSQVELASGGTTTIWLTPLQASQAPDDVDIQASVDGLLAADQKMTNVKVTVQQHIRDKDTPDGMKDRIPPSTDGRRPTAEVSLSSALGSGESLNFTVRGDAEGANADPKAGDVTIQWGTRSGHSLSFGGRGTLFHFPLYASAQTEPGHANHITVAVEYDNGTVIKESDPFSVAAIPDGIRMDSPKTLRATPVLIAGENAYYIDFRWGDKYSVSVHSDSGDVRDLGKVTVLEKIPAASDKRTGAFNLFGALQSQFKPILATKRIFDSVYQGAKVGLPGRPATEAQFDKFAEQAAPGARDAFIALIRRGGGQGTEDNQQYFVFSDKRTGQQDEIVRNSGFHNKLEIGSQDGLFYIQVSRTSEANNGTEGGEIAVGDRKPARVII